MIIKAVETQYEDAWFTDKDSDASYFGIYEDNTDYPDDWVATFRKKQDAENYLIFMWKQQ